MSEFTFKTFANWKKNYLKDFTGPENTRNKKCDESTGWKDEFDLLFCFKDDLKL